MMTNTHILVAATAVARPHHRPWALAAAWFGGFFPDMVLFVMVAFDRLTGMGHGNLWRQPDGLYWVDPWRYADTISNSLPLYALLMALGFWAMKRGSGRLAFVGQLLFLFAAGAFLGALFDLPVHTDDAHVHFWPFTDWRFISPVSYYQPQHYGRIVGAGEIVVGLLMVAYIVWKFPQRPIKILGLVMALPYILELIVIVFFRRGGFA